MTVMEPPAIPAHVPADRVLAENPWQGGVADPFDWIARVAGEGGAALCAISSNR